MFANNTVYAWVAVALCFGQAKVFSEDDLTKLINSESAQKRFSRIVRFADAQPHPDIKLLKDGQVQAELELSDSQTAKLGRLKALDIGHMYDAVQMYRMNDKDFDRFFGDLKEKRSEYLREVNETTSKILSGWQSERLRQIECQYYFLVYLEPKRALFHHTNRDQKVFFDLASDIKRELLDIHHGAVSDEMAEKYLLKLNLIAEYVGKRNLASKVGRLHRFWFELDESELDAYESTLSTGQSVNRSSNSRREVRSRRRGMAGPVGYSEYSNKRIQEELQLAESQHEDLTALLGEWKNKRNQQRGAFNLDRAERVTNESLFGEDKKELDKEWATKAHELLTDKQQERMVQLQLQYRLMAMKDAPELNALGFQVSEKRQEDFAEKWSATVVARPESKLTYDHVRTTLLKHFSADRVDEMLGEPVPFIVGADRGEAPSRDDGDSKRKRRTERKVSTVR